jgi:hypothetical protein
VIRRLLPWLTPHVGRLSPRQAAKFGEGLTFGCGYFGVGPVIVLFTLPARLRASDPPPHVITLGEFNRALRDGQIDASTLMPN